MTDDNALAVRQTNPLSSDDALASGDAWVATTKRWATLLCTGALPAHVKTPEMAIAICRFGQNYGWDEMRSLQSIYIVKGNPTLKTEAMGALVREKLPLSDVVPVVHDDETCELKGRRSPDHEWVTASFSWSEAKAAGLDRNQTWKAYRRDMLFWRASSRLYRRYFADATAGAYTREEMQDAEWVERKSHKTSDHLPPELLPSHTLAVSEAADAVDAELMEPGTIGESLELDPPGDCDLCGGQDGAHASDCPHVKVVE